MAGRFVAVLAVAALALAGCSNGGAQAADTIEGATATTGLIRGVVVDDAIRPVAGAHINVTGEGVTLNTTSGDDGLFRLVGLAPGSYVVEAGKRFYSSHQQAVTVQAGIEEPDLARFQLVFERASVPFAQVYKHEGYHECGMYLEGAGAARVCSNVNIATWIVVCARTGICIGNVTGDRSLFFQSIDSPPTFIQAELSWEATNPLGTELSFLLGGGTQDELKAGTNLPAFNFSEGPSPLMVRVSNHEGPEAWCRQVPDPPCSEQAIRDSEIGSKRVLLGQVDSGAAVKTPVCGTVSPCGAGWSMQQAFTLYTTVFYGYEPPVDWLFANTGAPPPPPV